MNRDWYAGDQPWWAEDSIGDGGPYVLLTPGGAGKATLVNELKRCEPDSISFDLRLQRSLTELLNSFSPGESSPGKHPGSTGSVDAVDAVDEALQVDAGILTEELREQAWNHLPNMHIEVIVVLDIGPRA